MSILALLSLAFLWFLVFNQLRFEWTVNPLYHYGWAIPALAAYLFYERWRARPVPSAPRGLPWTHLLPIAGLLAYFPIRLIQEANPDWILINWALAGLAVSITLYYIYLWGGLRWLVFFAFPVLFVFTGVPWPVGFENWVLQGLMRANAAITAETLTLCGLPALAQGNIIFIGNELVNVDEACSGIRSLQTAFMMSLFFGEFYRLGLLGRLGLVAASFALAFLLNLGRTMALTVVGGTQGLDALDRWHDPLGNAVLVLCLAGLWLTALLFQKFSRSPKQSSVAAESSAKSNPAPTDPATLGTVPAPFGIPAYLSITAIVLLLLAEGLNEAWYRSREADLIQAPDWTIDWPRDAERFTLHEFSETTQVILKYNEGKSATWRADDSTEWSMYYLRWFPGRASKNLAGAHSPDICLPAVGLQMIAELDAAWVEVDGYSLPFRLYLFENAGRPLYVFHSLIEDRYREVQDLVSLRPLSREARLAAVATGQRNQGQRVLGISISGPFNEEEAWESLRRGLRPIIAVN
ncbi:MAG: exosortase/archaeosortase family protein [Puniceicoccaceae bacterium]|nr:MAG: exosortase/archaeosortase family protein [Puniceicoccaceae bacterium]